MMNNPAAELDTSDTSQLPAADHPSRLWSELTVGEGLEDYWLVIQIVPQLNGQNYWATPLGPKIAKHPGNFGACVREALSEYPLLQRKSDIYDFRVHIKVGGDLCDVGVSGKLYEFERLTEELVSQVDWMAP